VTSTPGYYYYLDIGCTLKQVPAQIIFSRRVRPSQAAGCSSPPSRGAHAYFPCLEYRSVTLNYYLSTAHCRVVKPDPSPRTHTSTLTVTYLTAPPPPAPPSYPPHIHVQTTKRPVWHNESFSETAIHQREAGGARRQRHGSFRLGSCTDGMGHSNVASLPNLPFYPDWGFDIEIAARTKHPHV
jgi:hypothetical protein